MISEEDLKKSEQSDIQEKIARIEKLLETSETPRPFELGMLLALKMGQEIREQKELGSESGKLVESWVQKYPESLVEEAIATSREFLFNSSMLTKKIKESILAKQEETKK